MSTTIARHRTIPRIAPAGVLRGIEAAVLLLLPLALIGCGTHVTLERHRPAGFSAGRAYELSLVQLTGRPDLKDLLGETLRGSSAGREWWVYRDATNEQIAVFPSAPAGQAATGRRPGQREVFVRLDAYDALVFPEKTDQPEQPDSPKASGKARVRVRFAATVVGPEGNVIMGEREYAGTAEDDIDSQYRRRLLVERAAADGVEAFLDDITPRRVRERIRFDDDADDMEPVTELVQAGNYAQAAEILRQMRRDLPRRADVVYNLAVLTDAGGDYERALELYGEALKLGFRSFYADSRDACRRRLRDLQALTG